MAGNGNPFEEGRAAAVKGVPWQKCPYRITQKQFARWNCGYQVGLGEREKVQPAQTAQPAQTRRVRA